MTKESPDRTPLKRMLLHMLRHGGLVRSASKKSWVGKTTSSYVHFKDVTIFAAGECGLVKLSVNKRARAKQFVSLTPKGMDYAKMIAVLVRAEQDINDAGIIPEKPTARQRAGRTIEEALS